MGLREYHYATFFTILVAGVAFLAVLLYLQAGIEIQQATGKVLRRLFKTVALRQVSVRLSCRISYKLLLMCSSRSPFRSWSMAS